MWMGVQIRRTHREGSPKTLQDFWRNEGLTVFMAG